MYNFFKAVAQTVVVFLAVSHASPTFAIDKPSQNDALRKISIERSSDLFKVEKAKYLNGYQIDANKYAVLASYTLVAKKSSSAAKKQNGQVGGAAGFIGDVALGMLYGEFETGDSFVEKGEFTFLRTENGWMLTHFDQPAIVERHTEIFEAMELQARKEKEAKAEAIEREKQAEAKKASEALQAELASCVSGKTYRISAAPDQVSDAQEIWFAGHDVNDRRRINKKIVDGDIVVVYGAVHNALGVRCSVKLIAADGVLSVAQIAPRNLVLAPRQLSADEIGDLSELSRKNVNGDGSKTDTAIRTGVGIGYDKNRQLAEEDNKKKTDQAIQDQLTSACLPGVSYAIKTDRPISTGRIFPGTRSTMMFLNNGDRVVGYKARLIGGTVYCQVQFVAGDRPFIQELTTEKLQPIR